MKQLSKPLSLNTSQQEHANLLTRQRLWTTIIPMIARTRFLKEHTPSIKRNEYLVFKSLMRIKMATKAKVFGKLLHIVETNKFKRAQEVHKLAVWQGVYFSGNNRWHFINGMNMPRNKGVVKIHKGKINWY